MNIDQVRQVYFDRWLRQAVPKWPLLGLLIGAIALSGLLLEGAGLAGAWPNQVLTALAFQTPQSLPDKFLFAIGAQAPVGQFNYPFHAAVASDGTVYVADTDNNRVQHFSSSGAFLDAWGSKGPGDREFNRPHAVAIAPDGTVYVLDSDNHRIQRFSSTGEFLGKWGEAGNGDGQFWFPWAMTVATDGTVYVADSGNHRIQYFSPTGTFLGKWGSWGSDSGEFKSPHGLVASGNTIYIADTDNFRIQYFSTTGVFLGAWGSQGSGNGQFDRPIGIAMVPNGTIYVTDRYNHRVQRFNASGTFLGKWGSGGSDEGQFDQPTGIAIASDGTVYVADSLNGRIQHFEATGQFLATWGSWSESEGQFREPASVVVNRTGNIYVADRWNHRIQQFGTDGRFVRQWERNFYGPRGVAADNDGNVYVADSGYARIQKFTADGVFLTEWGSYGTGNGQFKEPIGVAVGPDNTVYVADSANHRIQRFTATGQFLGKWGSQGNSDGQFNEPRGVAVSRDGIAYVADSGNHRIQYFSATGQFLGELGSYGSGAGQFNWPHSVEAATDGTIYVADINNQRIQRFSAAGQFLGEWGSYGSSDGEFSNPTDVAVASDGTVYVADTGRIQAFGPSYPSTWRGEYFANRWLAEAPVLIRQDAAIDFDWGSDSPGPEVPAESFSARWYRYLWFEEGSYAFTVHMDDGVRLWVGEQLLIDQWWHPQISTYTADVYLNQGYHKVQMEYYEGWGAASAHLSWQARYADSYEPDDTCNQARLITVNGSAQAHNFHTGSDVDWVRFAVSPNNVYEIRTSNLGTNSDTVLELYDDTCSILLAYNDDYEGLASRIMMLASNSTTWYVKVRPYSEMRTGSDSNYDLSVTATPRSPDDYEPDDTCAQAHSIPANGSAQTHTFDWAEDVDWAKFTATAGTWYEILTSNLGSNADTVLELYDTGCGDSLAANDDYMSGSLASRIIWVAPASSTYYVKVRPYSSSRTGTGSDYDLTVAITMPHGIPLRVRNQAGNPATTYFWTEAYVAGTASPIFRDSGGMSGYSFLNVPDGTYTLVTGSGNDRFLLMQQDVVAPSTLTLDTGGTVAVDVYAYQRDGSPLKGQTSAYLRPYYGSYGWVGRPDEDGYLNVYATPANYTAFVWSWDYLYYLVQPNLGIWGPTTLSFDSRTMPTGQVNVSLQGMDLARLSPWGGRTSWAPYLTVYDGDSIVFSPDSYDATGYLRKYTTEEGYWYYYFSASEPLDVTAGGATTFRGGGTFSASTGAEQPQYRPGQEVTITNTFQDAFANRLTLVEVYAPASATSVEAAKQQVRESLAVFHKGGEVMKRGQERKAVQPVSGMDIVPSLEANIRPSRPELSGAGSAGWSYVYPLTTVRSPTNLGIGEADVLVGLCLPADNGTLPHGRGGLPR